MRDLSGMLETFYILMCIVVTQVDICESALSCMLRIGACEVFLKN